MSLFRKVNPSMRGISMSSVSTSGESDRILSRATYGSGAVPTTSISCSAESASLRILRTMAESSTIRTRIFRFIAILPPSLAVPSFVPSRSPFDGLAVDRRPDVFERVRNTSQALRVSYEQISARLERSRQLLHHLFLRSRVEIDHDVAAEDHREIPRPREGLHQVQPAEAGLRPHRRSHPQPAFYRIEIAVPPCAWNPLTALGGIDAALREPKRTIRN